MELRDGALEDFENFLREIGIEPALGEDGRFYVTRAQIEAASAMSGWDRLVEAAIARRDAEIRRTEG